MTKKEKAIREFARAMRMADVGWISRSAGKTTPHMDMAWNTYVIECMKEADNGRLEE